MTATQSDQRIIGLTGGIATGKSTVGRMLSELGAALIDADAIVHALQAPGQPLLQEMVREFGIGILRDDGALDREGFGARVFADPKLRAQLGSLVHPAVGKEMSVRVQAALAAGRTPVVLDIPLLFEGRTRRAAQQNGAATSPGGLPQDAPVVLVYAPREVQVERLVKREGLSRRQAEARIDSQLDIEKKREQADLVIDNSGSQQATRKQVEILHSALGAARERLACETQRLSEHANEMIDSSGSQQAAREWSEALQSELNAAREQFDGETRRANGRAHGANGKNGMAQDRRGEGSSRSTEKPASNTQHSQGNARHEMPANPRATP